MSARLLLVLVILTLSLYASATPPMEPWSEESVQSALKDRGDFSPFPCYQDRNFWTGLVNNPSLKPDPTVLLKSARELKGKDLPLLPASKYLEFQRNGNRTRYQNLLSQRDEFLNTFTVAECLSGTGEFIDPLMDTIWAFCEESDWCYPAHTKGLIDMKAPHIDLRSTHIAATLAMLDYVFNDALPQPVRQRIRYELDRRIFEPFLTREFHWATVTNNWNAVCNGSIIRTALLIGDDPERLSKVILRAQNGLCHYFDGFDEDGGTAEGIGYWNYGFSHYVMAAQLLSIASGNRLNLLAPPLIQEIALFPMKIELSPGKFPSFSDGGDAYTFYPGWTSYLADAIESEKMRDFLAARMKRDIPASSLLALLTATAAGPLPPAKEKVQMEPFVYFRGMEWMISRAQPDNPNGLVLAAQGGNNAENHNHNDVGNFILHNHAESILVDLGAPEYDKAFFSSIRYTYLAARSMGHSVPLVNGQEQRAGAEAKAVVQATHTKEVDTFKADMTSAYPPEAKLQSLIRTLSLHRSGEGSWVEVEDRYALSEAGLPFESALITYGKIQEESAGKVTIQGDQGTLRIEFDPGQLQVNIREFDSQEEHLRVADEHSKVRRIAFQVKEPGKEGVLNLKLVPSR